MNQETLNTCTEFAKRIAPEIAAFPVYLMNIPKNYPTPVNTRAFSVAAGIDLSLRRDLIERGEWRGPGAVSIVFCDPQDDLESALGLTIHELAHCLPLSVPPSDQEPTPAQFDGQFAKIADWAKTDETKAIDEPRYVSTTVEVAEQSELDRQAWLSEKELQQITADAIAELAEHAEQCRQEYKSHAGAI